MIQPDKRQNERMTIMTNAQPKSKPLYRVSFASFIGKDEKGNDRLGSAREIGSVWPRKDGKSPIIRFDIIPIELTQRQGVLFLNPVGSTENAATDEVAPPA
jgi:hypothetical protein